MQQMSTVIHFQPEHVSVLNMMVYKVLRHYAWLKLSSKHNSVFLLCYNDNHGVKPTLILFSCVLLAEQPGSVAKQSSKCCYCPLVNKANVFGVFLFPVVIYLLIEFDIESWAVASAPTCHSECLNQIFNLGN